MEFSNSSYSSIFPFFILMVIERLNCYMKSLAKIRFTQNRVIYSVALASILWCIPLSIWLALDNHIPSSDEASHIIDAIQYKNLFEHFRPFSASWWFKSLRVNNYYPPLAISVTGLFLAIFDDWKLAVSLCKILWLFIANYSMGLIALKVCKKANAYMVAIALFNSSILVCSLSHYAMLDMPLLAMVAAGLAILLYPSSILSCPAYIFTTGIFFGVCLMAKQVAVSYLAGPLLVCIMINMTKERSRESIKRWILFLVALIIVVAPWIIVNCSSILNTNAEIAGALATRGTAIQRFMFNFLFYLATPIFSTNVIICCLAVVGLVRQKARDISTLVYLLLSIFPTLFALSILTCQPARDRHFAPCVILIVAIATRGFFDLKAKGGGFSVVAHLAFAFSIVLAICYSFSPSIIADKFFLNSVTTIFPCYARDHISPFFTSSSISYWNRDDPDIFGNKLLQEISQIISDVDSRKAVFVNVTAQSGGLDTHSLDFLARAHGYAFKSTSSRSWTAMGDKEQATEENATNYQWYIIKNGDQGFRFFDAENEQKHFRLIQFVRLGGKFQLVRRLSASDGCDIYLYRLK